MKNKEMTQCQQLGCGAWRAKFAMVEMPHLDTGNLWCRECVGWYIFDTLAELRLKPLKKPGHERLGT